MYSFLVNGCQIGFCGIFIKLTWSPCPQTTIECIPNSLRMDKRYPMSRPYFAMYVMSARSMIGRPGMYIDRHSSHTIKPSNFCATKLARARKVWSSLGAGNCYLKGIVLFFPTDISETVPRFLKAATYLSSTRDPDHHLPTLLLEHLSLSLKSNLALNSY
jgi:hypothetical protein